MSWACKDKLWHHISGYPGWRPSETSRLPTTAKKSILQFQIVNGSMFDNIRRLWRWTTLGFCSHDASISFRHLLLHATRDDATRDGHVGTVHMSRRLSTHVHFTLSVNSASICYFQCGLNRPDVSSTPLNIPHVVLGTVVIIPEPEVLSLTTSWIP